MVTRRYVMVMALVGIGGLGLAAEFTQKREKKNISINTLKEERCEQFGEVLKQIPLLLHTVARLQTEALTIIQGYWEGDKQSWCAQAPRHKLQGCRDRLTSLQKKIDTVLAECEQVFKEIKG